MWQIRNKKLLKPYLTDRLQTIATKGNCSMFKTIITGVPQESIIGPLLFLFYIQGKDICNVKKIRKLEIICIKGSQLTTIVLVSKLILMKIRTVKVKTLNYTGKHKKDLTI